MTRVSFYVLKGNKEQDRQVFACRLIEKAYFQGHRIFVYTENEQQSKQLDQTLWSFRSDSFIPHKMVDNQNTNLQSSILIGHDTKPPKFMDLLVNLSVQQPVFFSQFERVAEFINDDINIKEAGRQRYRFYQQRGYEVNTFKI